MRRSHVCFFGLVTTCDVRGTCPTQKLPLFFNLIQMGPRKNKNLVFRRSPGRGGIVPTSSKTTEKNYEFLHFLVRLCQLNTCTTCVIHVQKFHLTRVVCCFILTWGGVWCRFLVLLSTLVYLPLAHPEQCCHSWVFSRVCWDFACKGMFQLRQLSFQRLCLSFCSNMALVALFRTMYGVG